MDFNNKIAVVTGGAQGIGQCIAELSSATALDCTPLYLCQRQAAAESHTLNGTDNAIAKPTSPSREEYR